MSNDPQLQSDDLTVFDLESGRDPGTGKLTDSKASVHANDVNERKEHSARNVSLETYSASVNPLVAAAAYVLTTVAEIARTRQVGKLEDLNQKLSADIKGFHARALALGAENDSLNDASYVLCTVVDEAVLQTNAGEKNGWSRMSLLNGLHNHTSGGERFFEILTDLRLNPVKHLHLLELMYLCLALDFQGKYRLPGSEKVELEKTRDGLYRTIRNYRGDVPRELSPHWQGLKDQRRNLVRIVPWWLVVLFTLMCLGVMYSGFAWVLSEQRETVLEPYRQLDPAVIQPPMQDRDA